MWDLPAKLSKNSLRIQFRRVISNQQEVESVAHKETNGFLGTPCGVRFATHVLQKTFKVDEQAFVDV